MVGFRLVLMGTSSLGVVGTVMAMYFPQTLLLLAVAFGLPLVMYGIISLLELVILGTKRGWIQDQQQNQRHNYRGVVQINRALYEQLDSDMLELLMSNRDFDSNDYERLVRLQELNGRRQEGAAPYQIQQLPIVIVTKSMLHVSENANCTVCLSALEVNDRVRMMPCFHRFHPQCIDSWLQEKAFCPMCKFPVIIT